MTKFIARTIEKVSELIQLHEAYPYLCNTKDMSYFDKEQGIYWDRCSSWDSYHVAIALHVRLVPVCIINCPTLEWSSSKVYLYDNPCTENVGT